jgi:mono/diheme cytochrome c family protein
MKQSALFHPAIILVLLSGGCGSSPAASPGPQLEIVTVSGAPLSTVAGDAVTLDVVERMPDGSTQALASGAKFTWTAPAMISTLPPGSTASSPIPVPVAQPTVAWISNSYRSDRATDLANVLFVLDPGTVQNATIEVSASVSGASTGDSVTAQVEVDPTPAGDWVRGEVLFGPAGANCAECHGATGHGSPGAPEASTYTMAGATYDFPAPGINAEPGNAASNSAWNAALFAVAARADMNNAGAALRFPMPDWLASPNPATGQPLSTQDLADIYAFLKTQTH